MDAKREEVEKLEREASRPNFWDDTENAQKVMSRLARIKEEIVSWEEIHKECDDLLLLNELAVSERDESLSQGVEKSSADLGRRVENLEVTSWFTEELDSHDAIVSIHPGAGGTESQDWANILLRMYLRWAENRGFQANINDISAGEEAGIKSVTFTVGGKYAYGLLKAEKGVHRLVRVSPFDFQKRRHTSFASVGVIPAIEEEVEIIIDPKDLRMETYRATGAGGQHVNVTDSAVRVTHIPTGVVAQCQSDRSQIRNREGAMKILRARLFEREQEKRQRELEELRGEQKEIAWGSQIRSYVLHPYSLAKDHRTGVEKGNVQAVLDGELDDFIVAYHRWRVAEKG
ncbi:MAG TPA: peptide chain release factor 2 [Actinobacteria bacterium]|nr:peptide chain release factor 2 [Actinomycetota bacterium]